MDTPPIALVTGSTAGIGRAIARRLSADGYQVVGVQRSPPGVTADLRDPAAIPAVWRRVIEAGGGVPRLAVMNAGQSAAGRLVDMSAEDCLAMIALNLAAPLLLAREMLATWEAAGVPGHLVLIGSQAGLPGFRRAGDAAYAATKAGLHGLVGPLATEYGPRIRVNAVAPGDVATKAEFELLSGEARRTGRSLRDLKREVSARSPLGRWVRPREVADAVAFLDRATAVTGAVVNVSGGSAAH